MLRRILRPLIIRSYCTRRGSLRDGPNLRDFFRDENMKAMDHIPQVDTIPYLENTLNYAARNRKVYFDVYGCQMNVNDTEIVWSVLKSHGFRQTKELVEADVVLIMTCAIRDSAEAKIWNRLDYIKGIHKNRQTKIGILGCMAERLKTKVLEIDKSVDLVAGPDSYKDLPRLLALTENNQTAVNVLLSLDETYADVMPVRLNENSISAFVSIMRGCDNMCTYCIVPFTRGRERSRPIESIKDEIKMLRDQNVKEVTLLGQNVNSYLLRSSDDSSDRKETVLSKNFKTVYKTKTGNVHFADLLAQVAEIDPEIRIRFTSPHPKDFPDAVLEIIRDYPNVCKYLHMPAQSGNSNVLERMRRGYTREAYIELIERVRSFVRDVALSSDFICGFCGETEEEFRDTITLMELIRYNVAYLFPYSMREKTTAHRRYKDDVPPDVKNQRLRRMVDTFRNIAKKLNLQQIGNTHLVLVEGKSRRSELNLAGRNDNNIKVIFPGGELPYASGSNFKKVEAGDYVAVQINSATSQVLKGIPLYRTTLRDFYNNVDTNRKIKSISF